MITTKGLKYFYDKNKLFEFPDIKVNGGETLLILGRSGIGKSTLLHLLGGLMHPKEGQIVIGGEDITKMKTGQLDRFRGEHISIVFQQNHFIKSLNVWENLELAAQLSNTSFNKSTISSVMSQLNIEDKKKSFIYQLSEGEKQRVAITRAMVNSPKLILADEPTSALDQHNANEVGQLLIDQAQQAGAALCVVTHDDRLKDFIPNSIVL